jgi:hypothetical protein
MLERKLEGTAPRPGVGELVALDDAALTTPSTKRLASDQAHMRVQRDRPAVRRRWQAFADLLNKSRRQPVNDTRAKGSKQLVACSS